MRARILGGLAIAALMVGGSAQAGSFKCESRDKRPAECRAPDGGTIRLQEQLSKAQCIEGRTWGRTATGVYVNNGCRARFVTDGSHYDGPGQRPSERREIVNELEPRSSDRREIENQVHQRDRGLPAPNSGRQHGSGHRDVVGERANIAQDLLIERGYDLLGSRDGSDRRWTYFRGPDGRCLQAVVIYGRFDRIDYVNDRDCRQSNLQVHGRAGAPTSIDGYGSQRDPYRESNRDDYDRRDERYRDDDRGYDSRRSYDRYDDLIGARAASAEAELSARGFSYARSERRRSGEYIYYHTSDRRGCVRATLSDGRYRDIVERDRSDCR